MKTRILDRLMVAVIFIGLLFGFMKSILLPKDMNYYENRYANQIYLLSANTYLDGSFQKGFEDGLMDQVPLAQTLKKLYNDISSYYLRYAVSPILNANGNQYISFMGNNIFGGDYITYNMRDLSSLVEHFDEKIANYNQYFSKYNNIDFFLYYIEKDTDINFETNQKLGAYEYLRDRINLPDEHIQKFEINNFEEFRSFFYKTDHHWKYRGSYQAYIEVMQLLGCADQVLTPLDTIKLPYTFSGSKAAGAGASSFHEDFTVYRFDYQDMEILINGKSVQDYGKQEAYFAGQPEVITYGYFYGGDEGEVVFDTKRADRENILILGESYDNAILKLIASHYNRTYSVDLRNYEANLGSEFCFSEYIKEHNITKVLLIGNIDYFIMSEFLLKG